MDYGIRDITKYEQSNETELIIFIFLLQWFREYNIII
jgi:hypothetical protein